MTREQQNTALYFAGLALLGTAAFIGNGVTGALIAAGCGLLLYIPLRD